MLEIRKIARGYQVTLPRAFREKFSLDIGDLIEFIEENGQLVVKPVKNSHSENAAIKLLAFLNKAEDTKKDMPEEELLELARQQRKEARKLDANHH